MAKRQDKGDQPTRHVYKSSDVHKRRVGDSSRAKPAKMPSKREARESARESLRINAEARAGKTRTSQPSVDVDSEISTEQSAVVSAERSRETVQRPQFTAMLGAKRFDDEHGDVAQVTQPNRRTDLTETTAHADNADNAQAESAEQPKPAVASRKKGATETGPKRRVSSDAASKLSSIKPSTIVIGVVLVLAIAAVAFFAFNRWGRYDDHADLQGTWYVIGTEVPITIDAETIYFNDQVSYHYEMNVREKTLSYTFGPMSGQGRYWFSDDRNHLVITDGDGYTAANTTVDDLIHAFLDLSTAAGGGVIELPQGDGIIAFSRTPEPIVTNEIAEGLVVELPDETADAQSQEAASPEGEQPAEEGVAAEDEEASDQEAISEDGSNDGAYIDETAAEEPYNEPIDEEEAA